MTTPHDPVIRPEKSSDYFAIRRVVAAAFGRDVEADLVELAVDPAAQGSGIGRSLVAALAAQNGETFVVLEGSPDYYSRLGFEPASNYGMRLPLPDWAPPEAAQVLPLNGFDPNDPTLNGVVIYPPPFDDLE